MKKMTKEDAIAEFGPEVVDKAESDYETDFDKNFWLDLSDEERQRYLIRVQMAIASAAQ